MDDDSGVVMCPSCAHPIDVHDIEFHEVGSDWGIFCPNCGEEFTGDELGIE